MHDVCDSSHFMFGLQRTHPPLSCHAMKPDTPIIAMPRDRISMNGIVFWLLPTNRQNELSQLRVHPSRSTNVVPPSSVSVIAFSSRRISVSMDASSFSNSTFNWRSRCTVSGRIGSRFFLLATSSQQRSTGILFQQYQWIFTQCKLSVVCWNYQCSITNRSVIDTKNFNDNYNNVPVLLRTRTQETQGH